MNQKNAIVIGGGLGGLSAAISLAAKGCNVTLIEKNDHLGGKLNLLEIDGYSFDMGPSIFTLPQYFESLFARAGHKFSDYVQIQPVKPHWRNFFEDHSVIDLWMEPEKMKVELEKVHPKAWDEYQAFCKYSKHQYDLIAKGFFDQGLDGFIQMWKFYGLKGMFNGMDALRTMHQAVSRSFTDPRLVNIFDYFIKYVGSSAMRAPAFFNLMPHIQIGYDLWYVKGGMYNLARGLEKLMGELEITVRKKTLVKKIIHQGNSVQGVELENGETLFADVVVSNMEVIPAMRELLDEAPAKVNRKEKFLEPACSGLVVHLGTNKVYPQLAHHNFFFSKDQEKHFKTVFSKKEIPEDPTLYVVAPTRSDPNQAPPGCDNIKILPHIPHLANNRTFTAKDYEALKERVIDKLVRLGLSDLREHIVVEHVWTPYDIQKNYLSNRGAIYGVASDLFRNYGFKAPKKSPDFKNLYYVGGSVNPGGGMPMVVLSGQKAADLIEKDGHLKA